MKTCALLAHSLSGRLFETVLCSHFATTAMGEGEWHNASVYVSKFGGLIICASSVPFTLTIHSPCATYLFQPVPLTGSSKDVPCVIMSM